MRLSVAVLVLALAGAHASAQEKPKQAGSEVPVPHRTKFVLPQYPPEAAAKGLRGIVILELVVDTTGHVSSAEVVRSVPPFDEAALAAVRQWEYEVTKVDGRPVSVRLTVPITFAVKLPQMSREPGIPPLRQGAAPLFPRESKGPGRAVAEVTLDRVGQVAEARILEGEAPWSESLFQAIRSWQFALDGSGGGLSFKVEADFVPAKGSESPRVDLHLSHPKAVAEAAPVTTPAPPSPTPSPTPASPPGTAPPEEPANPAPAAGAPAAGPPQPPVAPPSPAPPAPGEPSPAAVPPAAAATPSPVPAPPSAAATPAAPVAAPPTASGPPPAPAPPQPAQPAEEILAGPSPTASVSSPPAESTEPGISSVDFVRLGSGVPDLVKGRRPVVPPFARMAGVSGTVEIRFAVDAAGDTQVQSVAGPELLKPEAEAAVSSWSFRRRSAERRFLVAVFTYQGDTASASVETQR